MSTKFLFVTLLGISVGFLGQSCRKMIEVGTPKTQLTTDKVFTNDQTANAVISNIYSGFNSLIGGNLTPAFGTYADELSTSSSNLQDLEYYNNRVSVTNAGNLNLWQAFYSIIYGCNGMMENLDKSTGISQAVKQQLTGEALFLRSFVYFFLVNIYGDVPLLLTTDVRVTSTSGRAPVEEIYARIVTDLSRAKSILTDSYPGDEKVRVNRMAVTSLLARIELYLGHWANAESEATTVISSGLFELNSDPGMVFIANSTETILSFWTREGYTAIGPLFVPPASSLPVYPLTPGLIACFEPNDLRRSKWVDSVKQGNEYFYYPTKYRNTGTANGNNKEYLIAFRLAEQYLIRAEARAHLNQLVQAKEDLAVVRRRAGLPVSDAFDVASLLAAIDRERRAEFFSEWGFRFFDLKRTGKAGQILSQLKPTWRIESLVLPIPQYERLNNPNLSQNPGY